jgi:hypothetical protein
MNFTALDDHVVVQQIKKIAESLSSLAGFSVYTLPVVK